MELQYWIWIAVGTSFLIYIGIAIGQEHCLQEASFMQLEAVSIQLLMRMATAADWMSAASFISMAGIISFDGYDGSVYPMGWTEVACY